ncbi:hypothetical protein [Microbacterium pygmaeum]|uniref:hypothetical protein n=1 Tax=Microbacterium pygmaeum TaxID=370764 RepID=UPI0018D2F9C4|nr:hypothetical protein [Microbacterium pygmaeum]
MTTEPLGSWRDDTGRGDAPYDKGAQDALDAAVDGSIVVVSVKDDWTDVFPPLPDA